MPKMITITPATKPVPRPRPVTQPVPRPRPRPTPAPKVAAPIARPAPKPKVIKMVNRGAAGLLNKAKSMIPVTTPPTATGKVNDIAPALKGLAIAIDELTLDPDNARLHPERNMRAIETSLATYGQLKPIVVRRDGMVVMAGNGTLQAAKNLGWTLIAVSVIDMTEAQAAGFGLADNRTAELAAWDFEVVSRLERLASDAGLPVIGWTTDELEVLRIGSYIAPPSEFPEVDEMIETEHVCPKCSYRFSGGEIVNKVTTDQYKTGTHFPMDDDEG